MDAVITSRVRSYFRKKILRPPQVYTNVHFCHFTDGDYCVTMTYILISFVRETLYHLTLSHCCFAPLCSIITGLALLYRTGFDLFSHTELIRLYSMANQ